MRIDEISKKYKIQNFIEKVRSHLAEYEGELILKFGLSNTRKFDGEFLESAL
jgi:hypothetical protein